MSIEVISRLVFSMFEMLFIIKYVIPNGSKKTTERVISCYVCSLIIFTIGYISTPKFGLWLYVVIIIIINRYTFSESYSKVLRKIIVSYTVIIACQALSYTLFYKILGFEMSGAGLLAMSSIYIILEGISFDIIKTKEKLHDLGIIFKQEKRG